MPVAHLDGINIAYEIIGQGGRAGDSSAIGVYKYPRFRNNIIPLA